MAGTESYPMASLSFTDSPSEGLSRSELVRANHSTEDAKGDESLGQLLAYKRSSPRSKARLPHTEHPNALPASWR
jgi:hypothetical protein